MLTVSCKKCKASGFGIAPNKCSYCLGSGTVLKPKTNSDGSVIFHTYSETLLIDKETKTTTFLKTKEQIQMEEMISRIDKCESLIKQQNKVIEDIRKYCEKNTGVVSEISEILNEFNKRTK